MTDRDDRYRDDPYYTGRPDPYDKPSHRRHWRRRPRPEDGSPNRHRLYRNRERGILFGVCAGIADYFGVEDWHVRLGAIVALFLFTPATLLLYAGLAIFLPTRPPGLYRSAEEERFWRDVSQKPDDTLSTLRHRFRELEQRLAGMERYVTSEEYGLNREFRKMDR